MSDADEDFGFLEADGWTRTGDGFNAVAAGTGYALYRHGQDRQTQQVLAGVARMLQPRLPNGEAPTGDPEYDQRPAFLDAAQWSNTRVGGWDQYIGQEPLKRQLQIHMDAAKRRGERLPHTLLASGFPGVGKTEMARLIADYMGGSMIELVPPFNAYTLAEAMEQLLDGDFLFLDEIHKLADSGKRGAEILLKPLEEGVMFLPNGRTVQLNDITIIGATTDRDKLPEPVIDRFKIKPYFQRYSLPELARITILFAHRHNCLDAVTDKTAAAIARACRDTPRVTEELVLGAKDLADAYGYPPSPTQVLSFMEVEPDGITRIHIQYLTSMRLFFGRTNIEGETSYVAGEIQMMNLLRETKQGIGRIERFLLERGLIERTPQGRRLTPRGVQRAEQFIADGKGASHVA